MIAWARLGVSAAWIMSASLGCAGSTPPSSTPSYTRSPALDYAEPPRSASDGEVLGTLGRSPDDWLLGGATTDHLGPGWSWQGWKLRFEPERARAGRGAWSPATVCLPRPERPLQENGPLARAGFDNLPAEPSLRAWVAAMAEVSREQTRALSCDQR